MGGESILGGVTARGEERALFSWKTLMRGAFSLLRDQVRYCAGGRKWANARNNSGQKRQGSTALHTPVSNMADFVMRNDSRAVCLFASPISIVIILKADPHPPHLPTGVGFVGLCNPRCIQYYQILN